MKRTASPDIRQSGSQSHQTANSPLVFENERLEQAPEVKRARLGESAVSLADQRMADYSKSRQIAKKLHAHLDAHEFGAQPLAEETLLRHIAAMDINTVFGLLENSPCFHQGGAGAAMVNWRCKMMMLGHAVSCYAASGDLASGLRCIRANSADLIQAFDALRLDPNDAPCHKSIGVGAVAAARWGPTPRRALLNTPCSWNPLHHPGPVHVESTHLNGGVSMTCGPGTGRYPAGAALLCSPPVSAAAAVAALTAIACTKPRAELLKELYGKERIRPSSPVAHAAVARRIMQLCQSVHCQASASQAALPTAPLSPELNTMIWAHEPGQIWCIDRMFRSCLVLGTAAGELLLVQAAGKLKTHASSSSGGSSSGGSSEHGSQALTEAMQRAALYEAAAQHPPVPPSIAHHVALGGSALAPSRYGFGGPSSIPAGSKSAVPMSANGVLASVHGHSAGISCFEAAHPPSPNGTPPSTALLLSGACDGSVRLWRVCHPEDEQGAHMAPLCPPMQCNDSVAGIAWVLPPSHFVTVTEGGGLALWEVEQGAPPHAPGHTARCVQLGVYRAEGTAVGVLCVNADPPSSHFCSTPKPIESQLSSIVVIVSFMSGEACCVPLAMLLPTGRLPPTAESNAMEVKRMSADAFAVTLTPLAPPLCMEGSASSWAAAQRRPADERAGSWVAMASPLCTGPLARKFLRPKTVSSGHEVGAPPLLPHVCAVGAVPPPPCPGGDTSPPPTAPAYLLRSHLGRRQLSLWDCTAQRTIAVLVPPPPSTGDAGQDYLHPSAMWMPLQGGDGSDLTLPPAAVALHTLFVSAGSSGGHIHVWRVQLPAQDPTCSVRFQAPCLTWHGHCAQVNAVKWLPHARHGVSKDAQLQLASASDDGSCKVWTVRVHGPACSWQEGDADDQTAAPFNCIM